MEVRSWGNKEPSLHVAQICVWETKRKQVNTSSFLPPSLKGVRRQKGATRTPLAMVPFPNQLNSNPPQSMTCSLPGVDASFQNRDKHDIQDLTEVIEWL